MSIRVQRTGSRRWRQASGSGGKIDPIALELDMDNKSSFLPRRLSVAGWLNDPQHDDVHVQLMSIYKTFEKFNAVNYYQFDTQDSHFVNDSRNPLLSSTTSRTDPSPYMLPPPINNRRSSLCRGFGEEKPARVRDNSFSSIVATPLASSETEESKC